MTHQTWISGKAIRPLFAEPVTFSDCEKITVKIRAISVAHGRVQKQEYSQDQKLFGY